jgi:hypothetical protein
VYGYIRSLGTSFTDFEVSIGRRELYAKNMPDACGHRIQNASMIEVARGMQVLEKITHKGPNG